MSEWKAHVCVYHGPSCADGFACAWIARKKWPDVVLAPTNYGEPFPEVDIDGKNLLIADFSYKPEVLRELVHRARSIIILDHHLSAQMDLEEISNLYGIDCRNAERFFTEDRDGLRGRCRARFDMDHSGAALTWQFCFHGEEMPRLISIIEDRDLWRFSLPETRPVSLLLKSHPYNLRVWDRLVEQCEEDNPACGAFMLEALAIERFYDRQIAELVRTATLKTIGNWNDVPVAHASYDFASDLGHALLREHPDAPFAAVIVDAYGGRTYSLRSEDARQDVSEVARMFGGGGHRNSSGFRVPV